MAAMEVDKTPAPGETGTDGEELFPETSRSLEGLRHMRLMALLRDMVASEDGAKAAEALGVSYRTVSRAVESGRLTGRMVDALERHLLSGGGSAAARQRRRVAALEERVGELDERLASGLADLREAVESGTEALREEQAKALRQVERRLAALEAGRSAPGEAGTVPAGEGKSAAKPAWRPYRDLVTLEPEPGEEQVYGDATPVIVEWRRARSEFTEAGDRLSKAAAEARMLELEVAIIEAHELTLPPATYPWDRFGRRDEIWRRAQDLERVRVERNRALLRRWLRRALTLGLWWD